MAKQINQKAKLLYLQQILLAETDAEHTLTVAQIIEKLNELDIAAERKSLYSDIGVLQEFGLDIRVQRSRSNIYQVINRQLEPEDVMLLKDALLAAPFITVSKTKQLVDKLSFALSKYQLEQLQEELSEKKTVDIADLQEVDLRTDSETANLVVKYLHGAKIKKGKDSCIVMGLVKADNAFFRKLLGFGNKVKVIGPTPVRKNFVKYCKKVLNQYK